MTTASVLPAVKQAAENALKSLVGVALADAQSPLHGRGEDVVTAAQGYVHLRHGPDGAHGL
jgi:xanthine dehydrogenase YagR molybdenum-binding subunit